MKRLYLCRTPERIPDPSPGMFTGRTIEELEGYWDEEPGPQGREGPREGGNREVTDVRDTIMS